MATPCGPRISTGRPVTLRVLEEIPAGSDPARLHRLEPGTASRIMTGAPIPPGADAVLMVEETETTPEDSGAVSRPERRPSGREHRPARARDLRAGDLLLVAGRVRRTRRDRCPRLLRPGPASAWEGRPRVAVISTGDELVSAESGAGGGAHTANSNGPTLVALARRAGAEVTEISGW